MATSFDQQIVVITGAGRGLGFGMAQRFGQAGAQVILADLDGTLGRQAEAELQRTGLTAQFAPLDVRDPDQSRALITEVVQRYGRLDVWINNAGISTIAPAEALDRTDWDALVAVNLSGAFYCAQAAGQQMLAQGKGVIINIASVTGLLHIEGRAAYSVTKAGVIALTEALGIEWAKRGVRVVGIAPGIVATPMAQAVFDQGIAAQATYEHRTPMHRLGAVDEIAEAALFLASDEAAYITAETLRVDGGWTAYQLF